MVFAISMLAKEDEEGFEYLMNQFKLALADECMPKLFIIERNSLLKSAIQK